MTIATQRWRVAGWGPSGMTVGGCSGGAHSADQAVRIGVWRLGAAGRCPCFGGIATGLLSLAWALPSRLSALRPQRSGGNLWPRIDDSDAAGAASPWPWLGPRAVPPGRGCGPPGTPPPAQACSRPQAQHRPWRRLLERSRRRSARPSRSWFAPFVLPVASPHGRGEHLCRQLRPCRLEAPGSDGPAIDPPRLLSDEGGPAGRTLVGRVCRSGSRPAALRLVQPTGWIEAWHAAWMFQGQGWRATTAANCSR